MASEARRPLRLTHPLQGRRSAGESGATHAGPIQRAEGGVANNLLAAAVGLEGDTGDAGATRGQVDPDILAEKVYQRMMDTLRLELDRSGW